MKTLAVPLAIMSLLSLAQASRAADLSAEWYANIQFVSIYVYDSGAPHLLGGGDLSLTPPGSHGPFYVTEGPYELDDARYVSVPVAVSVKPDQSLVMPLCLGLPVGSRIAYLSMAWQTNYNPSSMYLDLVGVHTDGYEEIIWSQMLPGRRAGSEHIANDSTILGSYYFRVKVVPEPSGLVALAMGSAVLAGSLRRMRANAA